jgi:hypothetical protein
LVRDELRKTGFKATHGISAAGFQTKESQGPYSREVVSRQTIVAIDGLITEKRTRRHEKTSTFAVVDQASGLYVGPIGVVRFWRVWPPLIGDLLPYHFWGSWRLSEFVLEERENFPHAKGGRLVARVSYDVRHGDEEPGPRDRGRLHCEVQDVIEANAVDARLSGLSARIHCKETLERHGVAEYSHWYVMDRGWSLAVEGSYEEMLPNGERIATQWSSKLLSFEE